MHLTLVALVLVLTTLSSSTVIGALGSDGEQRATDKLECTEVEDELVSVVPHGFFLAYRDEFVPQEEVTPSSDGHYWLCARNGERLSFFVPPERY